MPTARAIVSRLQDLNIKGSLTVGYFLQYQTDGSFTLAAAGGGTPDGSTGQIQYNNAGAFGGAVALIYSTTGALLKITAQSATDVPLTVKAAGSQSANLQEWQSSIGSTVLSSIGPGGHLRVTDGSTAACSLSFLSEINTGFFLRSAGGYMMYVTQGQGRYEFNANEIQIHVSNQIAWSGSAPGQTASDIGIKRSAAGVLKVTDGSSGAGYLQQKTGSGAPSDTPPDGSQYIDITNFKLYVRMGGVWKSATLT